MARVPLPRQACAACNLQDMRLGSVCDSSEACSAAKLCQLLVCDYNLLYHWSVAAKDMHSPSYAARLGATS
eukprot:1158417-Pelagomonas_calceolata.AAC.3